MNAAPKLSTAILSFKVFLDAPLDFIPSLPPSLLTSNLLYYLYFYIFFIFGYIIYLNVLGITIMAVNAKHKELKAKVLIEYPLLQVEDNLPHLLLQEVLPLILQEQLGDLVLDI